MKNASLIQSVNIFFLKLELFDKDGDKTFDLEEFRVFIKYLGRNTHYLRYKKTRNFEADLKMIKDEIYILLKKMETDLNEFEFLMGFIKPPKVIMPTVQLLFTLIFTDHTDVNDHLNIPNDVDAIKAW